MNADRLLHEFDDFLTDLRVDTVMGENQKKRAARVLLPYANQFRERLAEYVRSTR